MTRIIACVDHSPCDAAVLRTAETLATLMRATVDAVSVNRPGNARPPHTPAPSRELVGDPTDVLLEELRSDDVVLGVIGSRSVHAKRGFAGHVARALLASAPVPLAIVAPGGEAIPADAPRILVPLDGTESTTEAVAPLARELASAGAAVVFLHVFDSDSLPPFVNSAADFEILAEEFIDRHVPGGSASCELRLGEPGHHIGDVADAENADAIVLAWRQDLSPGRAEVIRHLVRMTRRPLIVVPIPNTGTDPRESND